jgi:hypothetical protein
MGFLCSCWKYLLASLGFFSTELSAVALSPLLSTHPWEYVIFSLFAVSVSTSKMLKLQVCSATLSAVEATVYGSLPYESVFVVCEPDFRIIMSFFSSLVCYLPAG